MGANPTFDGKIDRTSFKNYLLKSLDKDASDWKDTLVAAVDKCFQVADTKETEWQQAFALPPGFDGDKVCHPISGETLGCVMNEMFLTCPDNIYKKCKFKCIL